MSAIEATGALRWKMTRLLGELRRSDLSPADKAVTVAQRAIGIAHLEPRLQLVRTIAFETDTPPKILRGLRDLVVRAGTPDDLAGLVRVEGTPTDLVHTRFARGDSVWIGLLGGEILCHTWFHAGPAPFDEDASYAASWALDERTWWSYAAAATPEAQASGVFVKVFQTALNALFGERGARRVQCFVRYNNARSAQLHERLGFRRLGVMTTFAAHPFRLLRWTGAAGSRHFVVRAGERVVLPIPPGGDA